MKLVKLAVFSLTIGLLMASCGSGSGNAPKTDSPAVMAPAAEVTKPIDTQVAPSAKPIDSVNKAAEPTKK